MIRECRCCEKNITVKQEKSQRLAKSSRPLYIITSDEGVYLRENHSWFCNKCWSDIV